MENTIKEQGKTKEEVKTTDKSEETVSKKENTQTTAETVKSSAGVVEDNDFTALLDIPMIADPLIANSLKEAK